MLNQYQKSKLSQPLVGCGCRMSGRLRSEHQKLENFITIYCAGTVGERELRVDR